MSHRRSFNANWSRRARCDEIQWADGEIEEVDGGFTGGRCGECGGCCGWCSQGRRLANGPAAQRTPTRNTTAVSMSRKSSPTYRTHAYTLHTPTHCTHRTLRRTTASPTNTYNEFALRSIEIISN